MKDKSCIKSQQFGQTQSLQNADSIPLTPIVGMKLYKICTMYND
jgi:hypothetical protein